MSSLFKHSKTTHNRIINSFSKLINHNSNKLSHLIKYNHNHNHNKRIQCNKHSNRISNLNNHIYPSNLTKFNNRINNSSSNSNNN